VRCQNLVTEKEQLKSTEARLISENEMLHRNQQSRDQLVISLEAIQVGLFSFGELYRLCQNHRHGRLVGWYHYVTPE